MFAFSFATAAVLLVGANAMAFGCMSFADAQQVATNFGNLLSSYSDALANAALSPNFQDTSESVNSLIDTCPEPGSGTVDLLGTTFASRAAFEQGQGSQPSINFKQLNIWHSCNAVTVRWMTTNASNATNAKPVVGIVALETCPAPYGSKYPWLIDHVWSEFDSAAWVQDLQAAGVCPSASSKSRVVRH